MGLQPLAGGLQPKAHRAAGLPVERGAGADGRRLRGEGERAQQWRVREPRVDSGDAAVARLEAAALVGREGVAAARGRLQVGRVVRRALLDGALQHLEDLVRPMLNVLRPRLAADAPQRRLGRVEPDCQSLHRLGNSGPRCIRGRPLGRWLGRSCGGPVVRGCRAAQSPSLGAVVMRPLLQSAARHPEPTAPAPGGRPGGRGGERWQRWRSQEG